MAQHVTFARMQVAPGKMDEMIKYTEEVSGSNAGKGWERTVVGRSKDDPNTVWVAITWDTSERYYANADSPEQGEQYERMRALLSADPEWFDCDLVVEQSA